MLESIRARLTVWYTAILALVLITFSAISYVFVMQGIRSATDKSLADTAHEFAAAFSEEESDGRALLDFRYSDRDVMVFAPNGDIVAASQPHLTPEDRVAISKVVAGRTRFQGFATVESAGGKDIRIVAVPIEVLGVRYMAVVGQDLDEQRASLISAGRAVLLGIPLALIVTAGGGYLLARKSLARVTAMSAKARQIGAETLSERILVENERDELGHLASTLNDLLERLQRAFTSQRRFMADASHELRTPLAIIQGETDVALSRANRSEAEYRESLAIIRNACRKLTRIVQNLFLLARSDAGPYPMDRSRFYLDELIADSVRAMRTVAAQKSIELECHTHGEMIVNADEELLQRMVFNLLDNAVKFTSPGGRVAVFVDRHDHTYTIRVADTGSPIHEQDRARIFERFYRGDRNRRAGTDTSGAGLGLPIAKWIAQAHGGSIALEDGETSGNTFTITLPADVPGSSTY